MVAVTTAVAVATGAVGWLIGAQVRSPADAAAAHRPPPASLVTVAVEKRALTATVTAQGTVAYGAPQPITLTGSVAAGEDEAAAAPLITKAPTAGRTLREGDVLLEVSGRPVFVFTGTVPMYRTLTRGSTGDDVRQLRRALRRLLPHRGLSRSGALDGSALQAVSAWYERSGYQATQPSSERRAELSRLRQAVTAVPRGDGPALAAAKAELAAAEKTYGITIASGEILFLPKLPVRLTKVTAKAGSPGTGAIGSVSDPRLVVNSDVAKEDAELLKPGMPASMEAGTGDSFAGTLNAIGLAAASAAQAPADGDAAQGGDDSRPPDGTPIRLTPKEPKKLADLAGQALKITIKVGGTDGAVLSVPSAAVYTSSAGQALVSLEDGAGAVRDVPVTTGLTTDGYVEITPADASALRAGDRVVVGVR
jgi:hypothetical protein